MIAIRRQFTNGITAALAWILGLVAVGLVLMTLVWILYQGAGELSVSFLLEPTTESGIAGGVRYQILGTLILMATTATMVVPFSVGLALLSAVYLRTGRLSQTLQGLLQLLNATPSIIFGILGFLFFFHALGWGKSWLAGGIVLAWMILPTVTISLVKSIESIPARQLEAARGLGLRQAQIVQAIILPQSLRGLITGGLLGLARAAGETAPILFVAAVFAGPSLPDGVRNNPVLALPYHIFVLAQDSLQDQAQANLWGAALVLVVLVVSLSLLVLPLRMKGSHAHE